MQTGGRQLSGFLIFMVLARLLDPQAFGLVAWAGVFVGFLQIFVNAGLAQALVQREEVEPEHLDTAFWANLAISVGFLALVVAAAGPVASMLGEPELAPVQRWLALSLVFSALSAVPIAILRRRLEFKLLAVRVLIGNLAGGVIGIAFAFAGQGLWSLVAQQLTAGAVATAVLWSTTEWRPRLRVSRRHLDDLLGFGASIAGGGLMRFVSHHFDQFLIGAVLGTEALGIYVIGMRSIRFVIEFTSKTLSSVALPVLSKFQSDLPRMRRAIFTTSRANALISVPAFVGLAAIASDFVPAVFGAKWLASVPVMQVLSAYAVLLSIRVLAGPVVNAMGKPSWTLAFSGIEAVLGVGLIAVATPWGIEAVAVAVSLLAAIILPFPLVGTRRLVHIDVIRILSPYLVPSLASAAMAAVVLAVQAWLAGANVWLRMTVEVAAGGVSYLVLVRVVSPRHFAEVLDLVLRALPAPLRARQSAPRPDTSKPPG